MNTFHSEAFSCLLHSGCEVAPHMPKVEIGSFIDSGLNMTAEPVSETLRSVESQP